MDRRTFIKATGIPLGASALGLDTPAFAAATQTTPRSSVVVVGGGAFGAWTALHLREMGHSVTLLDAYGPGNSRATSRRDPAIAAATATASSTRALRCEPYGLGGGRRNSRPLMMETGACSWCLIGRRRASYGGNAREDRRQEKS